MSRKNGTIGVYAIRNTVSGAVYVGSAASRTGIEGRWYEHRYALQLDMHDNPRLQNSWNKHGGEMFEWEILEEVGDKTKVIECEQYWIDALRAQGVDLYNVLLVAGSRLGSTTSAETKTKLSNALRGRNRTDTSIQKYCLARGAIFAFVDPDGNVHTDIVNLKAFADTHGLRHTAIYHVWIGLLNHHKGWAKYGGDYRIKFYSITSPDGQVSRVMQSRVRVFCSEHGIDISNLLKVLRGRCKTCKGWTIKEEI